jgi:TolB-like protein
VGHAADAHAFHVGDWLVEAALCRMSRGGPALHVRPRLIDLLVYLASNPGRVIGKDELLEHVWHGEFVVESVLARSVADLRRILDDEAATPRFIETIPKRGYRLIAPVRWPAGASRRDGPSIAVLPFSDLTAGGGQQYFCDGLVEELTTTLAGIPGLRVIARTSAFAFRDRPVDVREVGRQLDVKTVLEGAVQRADDRVRVTVQAIDTSDGSHIWSRRFDRPVASVFAIQDEIAQAVAAELEVEPRGGSDAALGRRRTIDAGADELYLRGRHLLQRRTAPALTAAAEYFGRAIERDPGHAPAHTGLAICHENLAFLGYVAPGDGFPKAMAAARRALQLDPVLAEPHAVLGLGLFVYAWQWDEAERALRRAIELGPSYALAHMAYSNVLAAVGRSRDAFAEAELAQDLDPLSPLACVVIAMRLGEARRFEGALEHLRATLAMNPEFGTVHLHLGRICCMLGRYDEAERHLRQAPAGFPLAIGLLGHVLARLGRRAEANEVLRQLARLSTERYVGAFPVALVHQGLGDLDTALEWYTKAFDAREGILIAAIVDPVTELLRSDPRFAPLVARMKLPRAVQP